MQFFSVRSRFAFQLRLLLAISLAFSFTKFLPDARMAIAEEPTVRSRAKLFSDNDLKLIENPTETLGEVTLELKVNKTQIEQSDKFTITYSFQNTGKQVQTLIFSQHQNALPDVHTSTFILGLFDSKGRLAINFNQERSDYGPRYMEELGLYDSVSLPAAKVWSRATTYRLVDFLNSGYLHDAQGFCITPIGKHYIQLLVLDRFTAKPPQINPRLKGETDQQFGQRRTQTLAQFLVDNPGKVIAASKPVEVELSSNFVE